MNHIIVDISAVKPEPGAKILGFFEEPEPEPGAGKICYLAPGSRLSAPGSLAPSPASPEVDVGAEFGRKEKKSGNFTNYFIILYTSTEK